MSRTWSGWFTRRRSAGSLGRDYTVTYPRCPRPTHRIQSPDPILQYVSNQSMRNGIRPLSLCATYGGSLVVLMS